MPGIPADRKTNIKFQTTGAYKDLIIIAVISIFIFILSYFFDIFVFIVRFLEKYPQKIVYIDEVFTALLTLSISFAIYAWRRWLELKKETVERIRLQEEMIKIAYTNADVERIIGKQLRCEIEMRRQEEGSSPSLNPSLKNKPK